MKVLPVPLNELPKYISTQAQEQILILFIKFSLFNIYG